MFVHLPSELSEALAEQVRGVSLSHISRTARDLSTTYRAGLQGETTLGRSNLDDVLAYAVFRMPATYAATIATLSSLREQRAGWTPWSMLDLGAGLGTGMWAAATVWPSIEQIVAVEAQAHMIAIGRELARACPHPAPRSAEWVHMDLLASPLTKRYDLVLIAYVLGWLDSSKIRDFVARAWEMTKGALVVVEPGTPAGSARVLLARDQLIVSGGFPVAPCPHTPQCTAGEGDWHHFSVRLPRSQAHRAAKGATLGYEDEMFA